MPSVFSPDSIAVIGASSDPDRIAGRPIEYLHKHGYGEMFIPSTQVMMKSLASSAIPTSGPSQRFPTS